VYSRSLFRGAGPKHLYTNVASYPIKIWELGVPLEPLAALKGRDLVIDPISASNYFITDSAVLGYSGSNRRTDRHAWGSKGL
jgi:hypothetical protein